MIRTMQPEDLEEVLEWAAAEGWNPGLEDAAAFLAADPGGFLVRDVAGVPVAAISVVCHSPDFAFLGLYLCRPEFRRQGHGWAVWQAGLRHAGSRTVGLDGVPAQQANYAASGFALAGRTIRFSGQVTGAGPGRTRIPTDSDLAAILAADRVATGIDRPAFLRPWFRGAAHRTTRLLDMPGGRPAFATVRQCRDGVKIGPLQAPDRETGRTLVLSCLPAGQAGIVAIDIPESCADMISLAEDLGLVPVFETARMYLGPAPRQHLPPCFAVATLELG